MKRSLIKQTALAALLVCTSLLHARSEDNVEQLREGNLALPTSQQPSPLFGYGQNIVDRGDIQSVFYVDWYKGKNNQQIHFIPGLLYGINDRLSLYFNIPVAPKQQINTMHSAGIQDVYIQGEYAVYNGDSYRSSKQITVLGALYLPTGNPNTVPPTGVGAPSFFFGATASYLSVEWYVYTAISGIITTKGTQESFGNTLFYQAGIGRNIVGDPDGWMVTPIVELFGIYHPHGASEPTFAFSSLNSVTYVGPSLWVSSRKIYMQAGVAFATVQSPHRAGINNKYLFAVDIGWKFNA